jgi:predicted RNase H-like HicB family nuclease
MLVEDYKTVLYRQEDGSWVADIPALPGCYALMPSREEALAELSSVFEMISEEYRDKRIPLPADTTTTGPPIFSRES